MHHVKFVGEKKASNVSKKRKNQGTFARGECAQNSKFLGGRKCLGRSEKGRDLIKDQGREWLELRSVFSKPMFCRRPREIKKVGQRSKTQRRGEREENAFRWVCRKTDRTESVGNHVISIGRGCERGKEGVSESRRSPTEGPSRPIEKKKKKKKKSGN